jgi:hypothetical protein
VTDDRPPLNEKAEKALQEFYVKVKNRIHNSAEKMVLDAGGNEIGEVDVLKAVEKYPIDLPSDRRKWCIRILLAITFFLVGVQITAFYQLFNQIDAGSLTIHMQMWLILPIIFIFCLMIVFSYVFRSDYV